LKAYKLKELLEDIEREVGRISMDLQANEHEAEDYKRLQEDVEGITDELKTVLAQYDKHAEKFCEGSIKFGQAQERLSEMEEALQALEDARDNARSLGARHQAVEDTTCNLDNACNALTRAMEV